jgi:hypothetical protein
VIRIKGDTRELKVTRTIIRIFLSIRVSSASQGAGHAAAACDPSPAFQPSVVSTHRRPRAGFASGNPSPFSPQLRFAANSPSPAIAMAETPATRSAADTYRASGLIYVKVRVTFISLIYVKVRVTFISPHLYFPVTFISVFISPVTFISPRFFTPDDGCPSTSEDLRRSSCSDEPACTTISKP